MPAAIPPTIPDAAPMVATLVVTLFQVPPAGLPISVLVDPIQVVALPDIVGVGLTVTVVATGVPQPEL